MTEPTRDQIAQDYAKALTLIDGLRAERDDFKREVRNRDNLLAVELARVRTINAELLDALKSVIDGVDEVWMLENPGVADAADAVIAKAEG